MLSTDSSPSFSWSLLTDFAWRHHKFIKRLGVKRVVLVRENSQLQHPILQNLEKSYNSRVYSFVQSEPHLQVDIHVLAKGMLYLLVSLCICMQNPSKLMYCLSLCNITCDQFKYQIVFLQVHFEVQAKEHLHHVAYCVEACARQLCESLLWNP